MDQVSGINQERGTKKYALADVRVAPGTVDSNIILPIITTIILLAFFVYLSYAIFLGMFKSQVQKSELALFCDPGLCAVDKKTGEKICPNDISIRQPYNPLTQVCSNKYSCSDSALRYAILSDGSTNNFGECEENIACRCSISPLCSRYIASIFQAISGNPYTNDPDTQFNQAAPFVGQGSIDGPSIGSSSNTFCKIPRSWLFKSSPGCATVPLNLNTKEATKECFNSNPCLYGIPAFITESSDNFTLEDLDRIPVGCVSGNICENTGENFFNIPIYDTNLGGIVCKNFRI